MVRPGRKGPIVTEWIAEKARQHGSFSVEVLDLKEINLQKMVEPNHPSMQKREDEHTKRWSALMKQMLLFL